jgi:curved DNA-binding protein CbpA
VPLSTRLEREDRLANTNLRILVPGIIGLDSLVRELNDLEPGLVKQLRKDLVTEIQPLYKTIKSAVESKKPFLSGFEHSGRTGLAKNPIRVTGKAVTTRRKFNRTSLVSIRTTSAAAQIADMSGRRASGRTDAGKAMIANLSARFGGASRFIYPAIEKEIPRVQQSMLKIIEKYSDMVNRRLIVKAGDQ